MKTIEDLGDLRGKRVLVRSDFNVPLDGTTITDDGRVRAALPTLTALLSAGARVVVTAHLGRPKGAPEDKYSLKPVAERLSELLGQPVALADDVVGESAKATVAALQDGEIALLENIRFDPRETSKVDAERAVARRRAGRAGRRLRVRRLRRRAPQAGVGLRRRAGAPARRRQARAQGGRVAAQGDRRPGPPLRRRPRRLEGVGQARRHREPADQGGPPAHRRRDAVHVPRGQGLLGGQLAPRGGPDRDGQGLPGAGRGGRRRDRAAHGHRRRRRVQGGLPGARRAPRTPSPTARSAWTSVPSRASCSPARSWTPRRSSGTARPACSSSRRSRAARVPSRRR